jgi:2-polyprenyl-3-methyl-5-hydroxy-6-metoxy-1,4-benzoquinol methylase
MENANPYTDKLNRWSSHNRIAAMLEGLPRGTRVLDVGAASGTLARICADRGYVMRGIEPNASWLGNSRDLYSEVYEGSLEQTPDTYLAGHAAVVCGDVLEHLVLPENQLERLVKAQPDGCIFIISVPNFANLWVRINLLFGHFDYADKGILDRTHLHFYTRKSLLTLLRGAGLDNIRQQATPIPLDLIAPYFTQKSLGRGLFYLLAQLTTWWPTLLGYQWVAKATKLTNGSR